jgi:hypothetical protein
VTVSDFNDWLIKEIGLTKNSASDVESRLRRAAKFVDICSEEETDYIIFKMSRNKEFNKLEKTVQSQLRRAVKLNSMYQKFKYGSKENEND